MNKRVEIRDEQKGSLDVGGDSPQDEILDSTEVEITPDNPPISLIEGELWNPEIHTDPGNPDSLAPENKIQITEEVKIPIIEEKIPYPEISLKEILYGGSLNDAVNKNMSLAEIPTGKQIVGAWIDTEGTLLPLQRELSSAIDIFKFLTEQISPDILWFPSPQFPTEKLISFSWTYTTQMIDNLNKKDGFGNNGIIGKRVFPKSSAYTEDSLYILARREFIRICFLFTSLKRFNVPNAEQISLFNNRLIEYLKQGNIYPTIGNVINIPESLQKELVMWGHQYWKSPEIKFAGNISPDPLVGIRGINKISQNPRSDVLARILAYNTTEDRGFMIDQMRAVSKGWKNAIDNTPV